MSAMADITTAEDGTKDRNIINITRLINKNEKNNARIS
jgi:hypothetical protein